MSKAKNLIYLAVPYSHPDPAVREERFQKVNTLAARLMAEGLLIFSPISHTHPIALSGVRLPTSWDFWATYDIAILRHCKELFVYMLPGWRESVGVTGEITYAKEHKIKIKWLAEEFELGLFEPEPDLWPIINRHVSPG